MSNAELMVALRDAINRSGLTKTAIREQAGIGNATIEYVFGHCGLCWYGSRVEKGRRMKEAIRIQFRDDAREISALYKMAMVDVPSLQKFVLASFRLARRIEDNLALTINDEHFANVSKWKPEYQIEALKWACEVGATVEEMRAWMMAHNGLDLSSPESSEFESLMRGES